MRCAVLPGPGPLMRTLWLAIALAPYVLIAGIDAWMHERGRKVPRPEQAIHAALALAMVVFLPAVFIGRPVIAFTSLAVFVALLVWDETGFHAGIAANERRIHIASWIALAGFVICWRLLDA